MFLRRIDLYDIRRLTDGWFTTALPSTYIQFINRLEGSPPDFLWLRKSFYVCSLIVAFPRRPWVRVAMPIDFTWISKGGVSATVKNIDLFPCIGWLASSSWFYNSIFKSIGDSTPIASKCGSLYFYATHFCRRQRVLKISNISSLFASSEAQPY